VVQDRPDSRFGSVAHRGSRGRWAGTMGQTMSPYCRLVSCSNSSRGTRTNCSGDIARRRSSRANCSTSRCLRRLTIRSRKISPVRRRRLLPYDRAASACRRHRSPHIEGRPRGGGSATGAQAASPASKMGPVTIRGAVMRGLLALSVAWTVSNSAR
jgi:hypothetical protein